MKCKPFFIHQYALSRLKSEGYRLALASNSVRLTIDMMMEKSDLVRYFDFMLSNQDVTKAKPDPEIYQTAINRLGLEPVECLVVEDNQNGVKAALASGANLLKVETVYDVTYSNIKDKIKELELSLIHIYINQKKIFTLRSWRNLLQLMFLLTCGALIWILFLKICLEVPYPKLFLISIKDWSYPITR